MKKIMLMILLFTGNFALSYQLNVCHFFKKHPTWYWTAQNVQHKWHVPISVQIAIIQEESSFKADAETKQEKLFGIIPWFHESTAEGFSQALTDTWHRYIRANHKISADRSDFDDADDFLGWYAHLIHRELGIRESNAFRLYLAYHEGIHGYRKRTYWHKPRLLFKAHEVSKHAKHYHYALLHCQHGLPKKPWWQVW